MLPNAKTNSENVPVPSRTEKMLKTARPCFILVREKCVRALKAISVWDSAVQTAFLKLLKQLRSMSNLASTFSIFAEYLHQNILH